MTPDSNQNLIIKTHTIHFISFIENHIDKYTNMDCYVYVNLFLIILFRTRLRFRLSRHDHYFDILRFYQASNCVPN